jgi:hypothetical protein
MPLERAFAEVTSAAPAPLGEELRAVLCDAELHGVPLEAAPGELERRLPRAPTPHLLVAPLQKQRRVTVARIAGATAMARLQAKVLAFVPLAAFVWVHSMSPQTVAGYETPAGQVKLLLLAAWVVLGYVVSQRIVSGVVGGRHVNLRALLPRGPDTSRTPPGHYSLPLWVLLMSLAATAAATRPPISHATSTTTYIASVLGLVDCLCRRFRANRGVFPHQRQFLVGYYYYFSVRPCEWRHKPAHTFALRPKMVRPRWK